MFSHASHSLSALRAYLEPFTLILSDHLPDGYPVRLSQCWASSLSLFLLPQGSWRICFTKTGDVGRIQKCIVIRDVKSTPILVSSVKSSTIFTIMSRAKNYFQPYFVLICFSLLITTPQWRHWDYAYTVNLMCVQLFFILMNECEAWSLLSTFLLVVPLYNSTKSITNFSLIVIGWRHNRIYYVSNWSFSDIFKVFFKLKLDFHTLRSALLS